jgi:hypothetical protein
MANQYDVNIVSVDFGAYIGATHRPLIYIPASGGGVSVIGAKVVGSGAGTAIGLLLVKMTDAGTPAVSGTIGAFAGTVVYAEGVPASASISSAFVDGGSWIGIDQTSGTAPANAVLTLSYVMGKSG